MPNAPFCTCMDTKCSCHPHNHDQGCTPCIAKNLHQDEIPACFYRKVSEDVSGLAAYTIDAFVDFARGHGRGTGEDACSAGGEE